MSKLIESARRSLSAKTETLSRRQTKAQAVAELGAKRREVAHTRAAHAKDTAARAERQVARLEERLAKAKARLAQSQERAVKAELRAEQVEEITKHHSRKAEGSAGAAREKAEAAGARVTALEEVELTKAAEVEKPAGEVEGEDGVVHPLSREAVGVVRRVLGSRRSGCLQPLDGVEAVAILSAVDGGRCSVGDTFEVKIRGRKTPLLFTVEEEGLRFEAVRAAVGV